MNTSTNIPAASINVLELKSKVAELQGKLIAAHPQLPGLLRVIHSQLRADPEIVTLLEEEEIGIIVNGLKLQTQTEIVISAPKAPSAAKAIKEARKVAGTAADLF